MKNKEYVFYDDTDICSQYQETKNALFEMYREDYDWYSADDVPDDMIWKEISSHNDDEFHYLKYSLSRVIDGNYCLIKGTCGRWTGKQECGRFIQSVDELISGLQHLDNIRFYEVNGHFYIEGSHHDGSDYYELKLLTKKGVEYADKNYFAHDRQLHTTIFKNNFYSTLPRFYSKLYGKCYG